MAAPTDDASPQRAAMAKTVLGGAITAGLSLWILVVMLAVIRKPGLDTLLGGLFGGFFCGLLVMGAGAWLGMRIMLPPKGPDVADTARGLALETSLKDVLAELETTRLDIVRKVNARAMLRVPLCIATAVVILVMGAFNEKGKSDDDLFGTISVLVMGGVLGYVWASGALSNEYAKLYKSRVLPRLASQYGDISYRPAVLPDLAAMKNERLFRNYDNVDAADQLYGVHRGLKVVITEATLTEHKGKEKRTEFSGLLIEVELPKKLQGVTAVIADGGAVGNWRDRMLGNGRQRIILEDPVFEKVYEVYGSDQVEARFLLNPAFMERLLALGANGARPLALAENSRLTIALPRGGSRQLFAPPSFSKPAANREALVKLDVDIRALLEAADAVIALDSPARAKGIVS